MIDLRAATDRVQYVAIQRHVQHLFAHDGTDQSCYLAVLSLFDRVQSIEIGRNRGVLQLDRSLQSLFQSRYRVIHRRELRRLDMDHELPLRPSEAYVWLISCFIFIPLPECDHRSHSEQLDEIDVCKDNEQ